MKTFNLPDLGEGLPEAEIVSWKVSVGDEIKEDQPMLEVENAKAIMEVPAPFSGKVVKLHASPGDIVETGKPLVDIEPEEEAVQATEEKAAADAATVVGKVTVGSEVVNEQAVSVGKGASSVKATPAVRALARKEGVDLALVAPSGKDGQITAQDVHQHAEKMAGLEPVEQLKGSRRTMARIMSLANEEVSPATIVDDANIAAWTEGTAPMLRLIRAMIAGCKAEPALNAWYDSKAIGRRLMKNIDLGIAVDMPEGLFVPVLRDVANLDADTLAEKFATLKTQMKERTIPAEDLRDNTITLSNVGTIAGRYASPVVVPPTVAILASGKIREEALVVNGEVKAQKVLPLSLTFDHRAVTGGEAARFLGAVIEDLQKAE